MEENTKGKIEIRWLADFDSLCGDPPTPSDLLNLAEMAKQDGTHARIVYTEDNAPTFVLYVGPEDATNDELNQAIKEN